MTAATAVKRLRSLKTFEKDDEHFSGEYKGWNIEITKEEELVDHWYIIVTSDRGTAYDGYYESLSDDIDAVILHALKGSLLYTVPAALFKTEGKM